MSILSEPASGALAVTPSDSTDFTRRVRGLYVGGAGDISAVFSDGSTATLAGVPAGSVLPAYIRRVNSTGTTATNIVALL
jgi:hypothetical protein